LVQESKTAVITGITGQDGFYLARLLLAKGYRVVGLVRRTSTPNDERLRTLRGSPNLNLIHGDITDISSIQKAVKLYQPDEFYHLAAQSHVALSWEYPLMTSEVTGIGTLNCLEAIRQEKPDCRFYFAGSSEQFGNSLPDGSEKVYIPGVGYRGMGVRQEVGETKLNERSPMEPESPYAAAKVFGFNQTRVYRRSFDMFATGGILFNHESPLRGENFVTRKITRNLARIKWGLQEKIQLGNMDAYRDWGFAGDYVNAMWLMLQQDEPDDFVIATGETHQVREFFEKCCAFFDLAPEEVLEINPAFMRPKDVDVLIGDASKSRDLLGWELECSFDQLVEKMCQYDYHKQAPDPTVFRRADEFLF
jgi:GDPmannose 4,6-dehydratase